MISTQIDNSAVELQSYVSVDEDGFLIDSSDWDRASAQIKALEVGVELNEKHWLLIDLIRDKYIRLGALPSMRIVCKSVGLDRYKLKAQFGSCLALWKIAGLPNPGLEAQAYMN